MLAITLGLLLTYLGADYTEEWYSNTSPDVFFAPGVCMGESGDAPLQALLDAVVLGCDTIGPPDAATSGMSFPYNVATYLPSYTTCRHSAFL